MSRKHTKTSPRLSALHEVDALVNHVREATVTIGRLLGGGTTQVPTGGREGVVMKALYEALSDLEMASDQIILIGYAKEDLDWKKS